MSQVVLSGPNQLTELLEARRKNSPFIAELCADNDFHLMIGVGDDVGFAQYSRVDGQLPYLVANPRQPRVQSRYVEFLINDTPTPIPGRYILNFEELKKIALHFFATGDRSEVFSWESM